VAHAPPPITSCRLIGPAMPACGSDVPTAGHAGLRRAAVAYARTHASSSWQRRGAQQCHGQRVAAPPRRGVRLLPNHQSRIMILEYIRTVLSRGTKLSRGRRALVLNLQSNSCRTSRGGDHASPRPRPKFRRDRVRWLEPGASSASRNAGTFATSSRALHRVQCLRCCPRSGITTSPARPAIF
jgi:hypothetical protein